MEDAANTSVSSPAQIAMSTAVVPKLLTAEEYFELPDDGQRTELVAGKVVPMNMPGYRHGRICNRIGRLIGNFAEEHHLGTTINNDAGIITARNPDVVRGADVSFYSFARVPEGEEPVGYPNAVPEIVFEVVSPSNTRRQITVKTGEYLIAGVNVVCVVDPSYKTVNLNFPDQPTKELEGDDALTFADLPGFTLPVSKFFE
jgi:Uma2 family endonuclease